MNMNKTFQALFGPIQAEETLKDRTRAFLAEETQNYSEASVRKRRYPAYAAACACLLLALLGGRWLYFTPTAEISIDINPSIELSVNRFDRVIGINAFNKDGWTLSNGLDIKYRNCTQAVEQILRHENVAALLSGDEVMTITVVGPDGRQSAKLLSDIETCIAGQGNIDCYFARPDEVANAHEAGLSCGKYRAFLELQLLDPDITPEAVQGMTMREIRDLIARLTPDDDNGSSPSSSRGNSPHGYGGGHGGRRHGRNG